MENMEFSVKPESNLMNYCFSCLKNEDQLFELSEIRPEIIKSYISLVKGHINEEQQKSIKMCLGCIEFLNTIIEFQQKCIESIEFLANTIPATWNLCEIEIKEEILVDDLPSMLGIEEQEQKIPNEKKKKKQKLKITMTDVMEENIHKISNRGKCPICYHVNMDIHRHITECHSRNLENGQMICSICEKPCKDFHELFVHLESVHQEFETPKTCPSCDFETKSRKLFVDHLAHIFSECKVQKAYACEFCNKAWYREYRYREHIKTHYGAILCKVCRKSFWEKKVFDEHVQEHEKFFATNKYTCDLCGKTGKYKNVIEKHMTIHLSVKEVECDLCGKKFKKKFQLSSHMISRHMEPSKICMHCGKKYRTISELNIHIRTKHPEYSTLKPAKKTKKPESRSFGCDKCDMKFFTAQTAKKHQYSHTKSRPYNCKQCSTGYYCNEYLKKHYLRVHGISYTTRDITVMCGLRPKDLNR
uniref:CSON014597 protein n=1 Tax=Culicoides sonorensis TaxID=179676 RepID=A0A336MB54_CULSO